MTTNKVLVIEDDAIFRELVSTYLTERGYQVLGAGDGETGLKLYQQEKPDVILCDLMLPKLSGLEVLEHLVHEAVTTPIIIMTASERMSDLRDAVQLGACDYLMKPIKQLDVLDTAIQNCLAQHNLEDMWESECGELDEHLQALAQSDDLLDSLVAEFTPQQALELPCCVIQHEVEHATKPQVLVVHQRFPDQGAFVLLAKSQALTGQDAVALLVLKSLLNPFLRQGYGAKSGILRTPQRLLEVLNQELCHSRIRTAFDVLALWIEGESGEMRWAHAGEKIVLNTASRPGLALGIWSQANYSGHKGQLQQEPFTLSVPGAAVRLIPTA